MKPRTELFLILVLSAALLSTALPLYDSLARTPEEIFFGEGVYVVSQSSRSFSLTYGFVEELRNQNWATAVSPEVYAFVAIGKRPLVLRGVEAEGFLELEGIPLDLSLGPEFLLLGSRLADDLSVGLGDYLLIPGSTRPLLMEAVVDGVLIGETAADELIIDLPRARLLAGIGAQSITLIRVRADGEELLDYLVARGADVLVGDGRSSLRVEEGKVVDDRIGALILTRPELGRELGRSYISSFAQYSGNSLRVLVVGMQGLTFALFLLILASSLVRFLVENRRNVGLIMALGGMFGALFAAYGRKVLGGGLAAGVLGLTLGVVVGSLLEATSSFALFGHTLRYEMDLLGALALIALYGAALLAAVLLSLLFLLKQRPRDLLYEPAELRLEAGEVGGS